MCLSDILTPGVMKMAAFLAILYQTVLFSQGFLGKTVKISDRRRIKFYFLKLIEPVCLSFYCPTSSRLS